jgi:hypothetical protein
MRSNVRSAHPLALLVCLPLLGCGSSGGTPPPDAGSPTGFSVGGSYPTRVTVTQTDCGPVGVEDAVTTVSHVPGSATLSLGHAGNTYAGTVEASGHFTTTPKTLIDGTSRFTLTISGQFQRTGFEATVHVAVTQAGPPTACSYDVRWEGTKDGPPNNLP